MKIKVLPPDEDGEEFVWQIISNRLAFELMEYTSLEVCALHEDGTESVVSNSTELNSYHASGLKFGIPMGNKKQLLENLK